MPESLKRKITENIGILERYPDPDYVELHEKLAQLNKVQLEDIKKNIKIMYAASFLSLVVFSVISVGIYFLI